VGLKSLKSLNLTKGYPNKNKNKNNNNNNNNNKVKSKPLELFELAGKKHCFHEWGRKKQDIIQSKKYGSTYYVAFPW
jgi:hypothetical protein